MYALLVTLKIDPARVDEAMDQLQNFAVPMIRQGEGFVRGTWFRAADGSVGHSLLLYETEQNAKAAADRAAQGPPPNAPTEFVSAEVFQVLAEA
jgi:quinol monooxygenase YgiN